ncbi:MAG: hypothetical protein JST68_17210 [Bacteroidetes bacterium]|nr:hypothetical protein [Bacteroidota bacterium]
MKLLAILMIASASVCFAGCGESSTKSESSTEKKSDEDAAMAVSAKEYYKKYQENEVAADNVYKGKKLAITGTVESINKDIADDAYISLVGDGELSMGVQCHLQDAQKAATVKKGTQITIIGTGDGMLIGFPQLKDGVIQ